MGILAQMGARVINKVNDIMFEQFVKNFRQQLQSGAAIEGSLGEVKPISAVGVAFSALKAAVKKHPESEAKPAAETKENSGTN